MITIIVPYRDRAEHLAAFIPHMKHFFSERKIRYKIVVVEQADNKLFNRARLLNIGVLLCPGDYYAFHDVDKLPIKADYSFPDRPRQIAPNPHQTHSYFGGVTLFNHADFIKAGGYSNRFWGWGGEDNEMMFRLITKGIMATWNFGEFKDLDHPRPSNEFDLKKWEEAKKPRPKIDGLDHCNYSLKSMETKEDYTHIKVEL